MSKVSTVKLDQLSEQKMSVIVLFVYHSPSSDNFITNFHSLTFMERNVSCNFICTFYG